MNKKIIFSFAILLLICGCQKPEVNYNEMFTNPKLEIKNNEIIVTGSPSNVASACYVIPQIRIHENRIYIFGTLSLVNSISENNIQKTIKLPKKKSSQKWEAYWINRDSTLVNMEIKN